MNLNIVPAAPTATPAASKTASFRQMLASPELEFIMEAHDGLSAKIVEEVTPSVLVKGQDWEEAGVVGQEWVEKHGGEVFLAPLVPGRSTTQIAERLKKS